jgi:hypothetical protein
MRTFQDYVSEAQQKNDIHSLSKLAQMIGISKNSMSVMYKKQTLPGETTILKLAELAGIPPEEALIDLQIWKAKSPEAKSVWEKLRNMVISLTLMFAVLAVPWHSPATDGGRR